MEKIRDYKDLKVWQKAFELCLLVYKLTDKLPKSELYGLTSQMRHCSVSIPSNIAEGYRRNYTGEYIRFLSIAYGSAGELETQLLLSEKLQFADKEDINKLLDLNQEVSKMLWSLISKIKSTA